METRSVKELKLEIQVKAKNGIDFIVAASLVWLLISYIWTLDYSSYDRSILTFIVSAILLPLAFAISKITKTTWKIKNNPLDALGLWLNFAQLIYFPFLFFVLGEHPDSFIMTYAIITGAHLFPYAWYYDEIAYAIWAVIISLGSYLISMHLTSDSMYLLPFITAVLFLILACWISLRLKKIRTVKSL